MKQLSVAVSRQSAAISRNNSQRRSTETPLRRRSCSGRVNRWAHFVILALAVESFASDWDRLKTTQPKGYVCLRASSAIQIDGVMNEDAWQTAAWTDEFVDIEGDMKRKPRFRTRAKMLWDDDFFYIAAELEEPHVNGTMSQRDSVIFRDNDFEVFIDPNGDNHEYYELEMNALNTVWDLFLKIPYKDGGQALNTWDIVGLKTAVSVNGTLNDPKDTDQGWTVELALPWKALAEYAHRPAPPRDGDQWRVNFSRVEWEYRVVNGQYRKVPNKSEANWVWSPQGMIDMHRPEKWGYVQFSTGGPGQAKFQPDAAAAARDVLMEIYYAEKEFQKLKKRWTSALDDLTLSRLKQLPAMQAPVIEIKDEGFKASLVVRLSSGQDQSWHITHDSRIWSEEK